MRYRIFSWTLGCCFLLSAITVGASDFEKKASQIFDKRFKEKKIDGTGRLFWIVAACDSKRLNEVSDSLPKNQIQIVEYEFTFEVNTVLKSKARIVGSSLEKSVEQCIIDDFYKGTSFSLGGSTIVEYKVRFPTVLANGERPITPTTPIGFITQGR